MRLYLSSFRLGRDPAAMLELLAGGRRAAVIANAEDYRSDVDRAAGVDRELADATTVPEGYQAPVIGDGLGTLPYCVLPHHRSDHPESPAIDQCLDYMVEHHLPFIALRDGQAIVRHGAHERVVG